MPFGFYDFYIKTRVWGMSHYEIITDESGAVSLQIDQKGADLLHNPLLNKGTAFSERERHEFGLLGLLPPHISTLDEQVDRVYENYRHKENNLEKYVHLRALQDRNETLFYALLSRHVEEMTPIIYTPTVGEAVQKLSHIYRNARGLWISPESIDMMDEMAASLPSQKIDVIVVTDNQGILGIGDQGAGGMGIPIGKLSLYTLGAGVAPHACLPISLDVGTDNEALLDDPLYLGHKHKRYSGEAYDSFIEKFVGKVKKLYPNALLQWEDFSKQNAFSSLDHFRDKIFSFNDDIQGTGAVVMAGVLGAMKIIDEKLCDQRFLVFGAGAGGIGVARQARNTLMANEGMTKDEAESKIFIVDSRGLLTADRKEIEEYKQDFAKSRTEVAGWKVLNENNISLEEVIENGKITILLGLSGQPGSFTRTVTDKMLDNCPHPLIFPLSNPTSKAEALPADIISWSNGRAIVATGSPFGEVKHNERTYRIGQGNNVFIFPGVGLGAIASGSTTITDEMFSAASNRLADMMPADARSSHCVFPNISDLHKVSEQVAMAVYKMAVEQGVATAPKDADPAERIKNRMWTPVYLPLKRKK